MGAAKRWICICMVEPPVVSELCVVAVCKQVARLFDKQCAAGNARTTRDVFSILESTGLRCRIYIPWYFLLFPPWWSYARQRLQEKPSVSIETRSHRKLALIHCSTAFDLYGIAETWTHCIVELYDPRFGYTCIDPYASLIKSDYPHLETGPVTQERISRLGGIKILVGDN